MIDKHYEGQGFSYRFNKVVKVVTVRLSENEIDMLTEMYPGKTQSFAIRSLIHEGYKRMTQG